MLRSTTPPEGPRLLVEKEIIPCTLAKTKGDTRVGIGEGGGQRDRHGPEAWAVRRRKEEDNSGAGVGGEASVGAIR